LDYTECSPCFEALNTSLAHDDGYQACECVISFNLDEDFKVGNGGKPLSLQHMDKLWICSRLSIICVEVLMRLMSPKLPRVSTSLTIVNPEIGLN